MADNVKPLKDKLQIYLITYNRAKCLKYTLKQIFAPNSPIRDFNITILNNASTDKTDEVIEEYQEEFPNLVHIKHSINIGGNGNIVRAFEMAGSCGKEYAWVLCDDDVFSFKGWKELENAILEEKDIICASNYVIRKGEFENLAYIIPQLTFVPAIIFKTELINNAVLTIMHESVFTAFPQLCPVIYAINNNKKIYVLKNAIMENGAHCGQADEYISYTRGLSQKLLTERKSISCWVLGFCSIITMLKDKKLIKECLEKSIIYKDIYNDWVNFYLCLRGMYLNRKYFNYFYEVYRMLKLRRKIAFWFFNIIYALHLGWIINDIKAIKRLTFYFRALCD